MTTEPLNPRVDPLYGGRFAENTSGIIAAINACILASGGVVRSYPANTAGIIQALMDLETAIAGGSGGGATAQTRATLAPTTSGEILNAGEAVYVSSADGKVYKATSQNTFEKANVLGLVKASVVAADKPTTVIVRGPCISLTGLTAGLEYFLDHDGSITSTPPNGGGLYSVHLGTAISSTILDVQPVPPALTT
ncbi:MAG TPA: hypothetical protein DCX77_05925 [Acidimicrobiaceae bacterium]|nr:hypothetical protein [Acidimicrobiaceae bacterium]